MINVKNKKKNILIAWISTSFIAVGVMIQASSISPTQLGGWSYVFSKRAYKEVDEQIAMSQLEKANKMQEEVIKMNEAARAFIESSTTESIQKVSCFIEETENQYIEDLDKSFMEVNNRIIEDMSGLIESQKYNVDEQLEDLYEESLMTIQVEKATLEKYITNQQNRGLDIEVETQREVAVLETMHKELLEKIETCTQNTMKKYYEEKIKDVEKLINLLKSILK